MWATEVGTELPRRGEVLVVGSVNMDLIASVPRHPRPGETVFGRDLRHALGGKGANQAVAAARMGAHVRQIACLGGDAFGGVLREMLSSYGVRLLAGAGAPDQPSGVAIVAVADGGENVWCGAENRSMWLHESGQLRYSTLDVSWWAVHLGAVG